MTDAGAPPRDPIPIGSIVSPPFARLPDPLTHFRLRAQRFAVLAFSHDLAPYLRFMAGLAEAQHQAQDGLPEPAMPTAEDRERASVHAMPPLDSRAFAADAALEATFDRVFALASEIEMPAAARLGLDAVTCADRDARLQLALDVLDQSPVASRLAEHAFAAAAAQVHCARMASRLDAERLVPVGDGACPSCGGAPVASLIVGWRGAHGTRFCACSLCSTLWHVVRVKCTVCGSTEGVSYKEIEDGPGAGQVRAEACSRCGSYVKIMLQREYPSLDPVADDVATLGLDLLLRERGFRRGAVNPFLLGY
jgi:FdhE protein